MLTFEEEASVTFDTTGYQSYKLSDHMDGLITTQEYAFSVWFRRKIAWPGSGSIYDDIMRLSNDPS